MDLRSLDRLPDIVERILHLAHDKVRHLSVYIAGELNKPRLDARLLGLPGKVKGIDRNTMPAQSGAGVERHEAERFGGGRPDPLPDVYAHPVAHDRHLVRQSDVDHAEGILK